MPRSVTFHPRVLSTLLIITSSTTILTSLLLTHFLPRRFRIHPIPYLSDAGLRDPERFILSLGMQFSCSLFLALAIAVYCQNTHPLSKLSLLSGVMLSVSLTIFTTVPGWWAPHHIFATLFSGSTAVWCFCYTQMSKRSPRVKCVLSWLIVFSFASFVATWGLIRLRIPYELIPNKDPRFIALAIGEYIGTCAFLWFVGIVGYELRKMRLVLSVCSSKADLLGERGEGEVPWKEMK